jgi:choline dehydrogenase-like flavoprotein
MLPYYRRAARYCEIGEFAFTVSEAFDRPLAPMIAHFDGSTSWSTDCLERFSCPTDFGQRYLKQLKQAPNLRVVLGATVVEVLLDGGGRRARGVDARTPEGEQIEVRASQVVVATGGLETARLLLASQRTQHAGLGNARDVVGRYYMSHLAGTLGRFVPNGGMQAVWNGYDQTDDGTYTRRRLSLRPQAQRKHQIGNVIARLHHPRISDPAHGSGVLSALRLMRRAIPHQFRHRLAEANDPRSSPLHLINILRDAPAVTRFALKMLVSRRLAARKYPSVVVRVPAGVFSLDVHAEQEPRRDSRVRLTHARDRIGMQRLEVDWRYSPTDIATVATAMKLLSEEICAADAGTLEISPGEVERELTRWGSYTGHHLGLARMGTDPRTSVVDANAMVHDVDGVYVAGAAVFPTSSQANPTLTAVALAIRLADHLATKGCHDA